MTPQKIPSLGYALLGLLHQNPASGYDLRKIFSSTSMKTYSDSPGAIYPALSRLQKQGLIRGTVEEGLGLRRRQVFRVTPKGLAELKRWITLPITRDDLVSELKTVMLRFAYSEKTVGASASLEILKSIEAALGPHLQDLREKLEKMRPFAPTSGRLALECGIRSYECLLQWTRYAIPIYEKQLKGGPS
jgi:PadR family transcriptional regulator, regulatory protein AphA